VFNHQQYIKFTSLLLQVIPLSEIGGKLPVCSGCGSRGPTWTAWLSGRRWAGRVWSWTSTATSSCASSSSCLCPAPWCVPAPAPPLWRRRSGSGSRSGSGRRQRRGRPWICRPPAGAGQEPFGPGGTQGSPQRRRRRRREEGAGPRRRPLLPGKQSTAGANQEREPGHTH